jgi:hypothetical protein
MNDTGFAMVISNIRIASDALPFEIEPRVKIAVAGKFEHSQFHNVLARGGYFSGVFLPPKNTQSTTAVGSGASQAAYILVPDSVEYIVSFSGFNEHLVNLKLAGLLTTPKFRFVMETLYRDDSDRTSVSVGGLISYHQLELMRYCNTQPCIQMSSQELQVLKHYHSRIMNGFPEYPRVSRALDLYAETESLSPQSILLTLSYFSILESLVTNGRVEGESITNQLRHKINLILRRSSSAPEYSKLFSGVSYESLWSKLYGLRSDIAHGNSFDFKNKYQAIKSVELVNKYLDSVVAAVIRLAIDEPELVEDLRSC